jgi:ferrous iron transport protein B
MGFGCNVPAVIATRSCSVSGRNTCISAISFGSACSYQFGAMLSVFAAAGQAWLVAPYLLYLAATTLLYSRWISRRNREDAFQVLTMDRIILLEWPRTSAVWREVCGTIGQFFFTALPVFLAISMLASALDFLGILQSLTRALEPSLGLFRLPGEAAIAIVMGSIRKDGILLLAGPATATAMTPVQVLTAAYLAGVLLPCLVTWLTVARERTLPHAARMSAQQALAACLFAALLAWGGFLLA